RAMKSGAYEYVTKPFDIDEIALVIDRALEARSLRLQNRRLTAEKALGRAIVGDSPAMRRVLDAVGRVGPKDITVLVRGDTGTGKELIASLIHAESRRVSGPLVRFNCASWPARTAIWLPRSGHTAFARTSITGWRWWSWSFRLCTSTGRTSPRWRPSSRAATPSASGWRAYASRPAWSSSCSARTGRETSGSWRTRSRGWWR